MNTGGRLAGIDHNQFGPDRLTNLASSSVIRSSVITVEIASSAQTPVRRRMELTAIDHQHDTARPSNESPLSLQ